jgi:dTDP-4-dehydrorhamnose reductase
MRDAAVLVTGGSGQLATALARAGGAAVRRVGRPEFDFDRPDSIAACFAEAAPDLVVNAAAWTAVDAAETNADAAGRANRDGPAALAALCARAGIPLIHVSTDYVFDGRKGAPYVEEDATGPTGVYGLTKRQGEQAVLAGCPQAVVLRTSWVYAQDGRNFVRTMLALAAKTPTLRVVADQLGCPTAADDLAAAILTIAGMLRDGWQDRYGGVCHVAGSGWTSWHGLATASFAAAAAHGVTPPEVVPIGTAEWPTPAARPADSRLDCGRLAAVFGLRMPAWQDSLARTITAIFTRR